LTITVNIKRKMLLGRCVGLADVTRYCKEAHVGTRNVNSLEKKLSASSKFSKINSLNRKIFLKSFA